MYSTRAKAGFIFFGMGSTTLWSFYSTLYGDKIVCGHRYEKLFNDRYNSLQYHKNNNKKSSGD